jgi:hypothetical protein
VNAEKYEEEIQRKKKEKQQAIASILEFWRP